MSKEERSSDSQGWSELSVWSTSDTHCCCARLPLYVSSRSATATVYSRACLCTSTLCTGSCALNSFIVSLRLVIVLAARHYERIAGITIYVATDSPPACEIHLCRRPPFQMNHSESRRVESLGGTTGSTGFAVQAPPWLRMSWKVILVVLALQWVISHTLPQITSIKPTKKFLTKQTLIAHSVHNTAKYDRGSHRILS